MVLGITPEQGSISQLARFGLGRSERLLFQSSTYYYGR
jgi:hypothetical protein